ncbi:hypothetical protein O6H91_07G071800 [Diphasiastrum complanatum]|uniref:Uncharacterized protein n=4 Tax=Diphasiastrum complanatum TaxID=34168 RepID=A0ACC2D7A4_DIPCM|nr:hypothetical protein O6H91_07G071800 [Diphasiastrum complanatum]KAJ7549842.1 hypothetical protein O6H91_07G071800 [Diphasiastrum complanatum]KAJ7549843.1 hypothetical protein O6H91_07G071800 [Diphasiastrum complanatum]
MVSADAVLAVIRASRPSFKSAHDRVAFAVHATFLASGYSLIATGSRALSASSELKDDEISCEGWNDMEDAYVFRYAGTHPDMWKAIEVKGTPLGDMLMVDAAPIGSKGEETSQPCHLAIKVTDFASEVEAKSYVQQYKSLEGLVNLISSSLVDKLGKVSQSSSTTSIGVGLEEPEPRRIFDETQSYPQPESMRPSFPPIPAYGGSDLMPGPGAGVFQPRRDPGYFGGPGGVLLGPNDPLWGRLGPDRAEFPGQDPPVGVPPGARFDPFGPPGIPGFEPNRFGRGPRRPLGQPHPDLEHFQPF